MIEVNEYVRTPIGIFIISHINIDFDDNDKNKCLLCQNEKVLFLSIETIKSLKHSKQLIDLVEVGDVIKYKIENVALETKGYLKGITDISDKEMLRNIRNDKDYKVLEILTKEQFLANCYKVGGE